MAVKAKIIHQFKIAPDGHTVVTYKAGDEVEGKIAERAIEAGAAIEVGQIVVEETKVEAPVETKVKKPRKRRLFSK
jgi:hypothetical protein